MKQIFLILAMLMLAGCTAQSGPGPVATPNDTTQPPSQNVTPTTCLDYCKEQPHIECVGEWNISGTYPDCTCGFVCTTEEPPSPVVPQPPPEQYEPLAEYINKTLNEMVSDGLSKIKNDFYMNHSGSFEINSFSWKRLPGNSSPGDIVLDPGFASDVKFDGKAISSIQASGYTIFTNTADDSVDGYGFAIFNDSVTMLDSYTGSDAYDIYYFSALAKKDMKDCWTYEKIINKNEAGWVSTYYFQCWDINDK